MTLFNKSVIKWHFKWHFSIKMSLNTNIGFNDIFQQKS